MRDDMKFMAAVAALVLAIGSNTYGQAVPAGVAVATPDPFLPPVDGTVHYALSASELLQYGYYGPGQLSEATSLSGDVSYQNKSVTLPFSLLYAGGVLFPNQQGQPPYTYQNVTVSQGLVTRSWVFNVADSFGYLPQSPTTGLSGIPGTGDLGVIPVQGPSGGPAGGVLTTSGSLIENSITGSADRQLGHATSVYGSGSYAKLDFLNGGSEQGGGLNSTQATGSVGINRRIDARSSAGLNAAYATYSFSGQQAGIFEPNFETRVLNVSYQRAMSRTLNVAVSAGPELVSSSDSAVIPTTLSLEATASLSYTRRYTYASVAYSRGVNGGSGVIPGAFSDSVSGSVGRTYGRDWVIALTAAYVRTSGLTQLAGEPSQPVNAVFDTTYGGGQVTRRITSSLSGFASYTVQDQSFNNAVAALNAFSGTSQTLGVGITFSPRSTRLGQF